MDNPQVGPAFRPGVFPKFAAAALLALAALTAAVLAAANPEAEKYWAQWRGPHATGVAATGNPPLEWSETKNVRWKVEIPGRGSSSPIVWGDKLFILSAVPSPRARRTASS